ncbi:MAG TPA: multiheme c-type cytochrome [Nitrospirota bacterium]|nr:multiheme c-type cytochrome [Nitrospirota bacterium]
MKNHVYRPLLVFLGIIALILLSRIFLVPKDFGVGERGYMYGWHRKGNEAEWKNKIITVKYQGKDYCQNCHQDKVASINKTPHRNIQCENCHGPAGTPEGILHYDADKRPKLAIDRSRTQCLRCHYPLPYPTSGRSKIRGIDPDKHNPDVECSSCHNPHNPMGGLR